MSNKSGLPLTPLERLYIDAAKAEELFDLDDLEAHADKLRSEAKAKLLGLYRKERTKSPHLPHFAASHCLSMAKHSVRYQDKYDWDYPEEASWENSRETLEVAEFKKGPVKFIASIIVDTDYGPGRDGEGEFTSVRGDAEDNADIRPSRESVWVSFSSNGGRERERGWYESGFGYDERRDQYERLGKQGAHEAARAGVRLDAKRFCGFYQEEWQYVGVSVTAFVEDIELGTESLWGIDWDGEDYTYVNEMVDEQASELYSSAAAHIEAEIKTTLDRFSSLVVSAGIIREINRGERKEVIDKLMDYAAKISRGLPKPYTEDK